MERAEGMPRDECAFCGVLGDGEDGWLEDHLEVCRDALVPCPCRYVGPRASARLRCGGGGAVQHQRRCGARSPACARAQLPTLPQAQLGAGARAAPSSGGDAPASRDCGHAHTPSPLTALSACPHARHGQEGICGHRYTRAHTHTQDVRVPGGPSALVNRKALACVRRERYTHARTHAHTHTHTHTLSLSLSLSLTHSLTHSHACTVCTLKTRLHRMMR